MATSTSFRTHGIGLLLAGLALLWFTAVIVGAETGFFTAMENYELGPIVVASVLLPALAAWTVPGLRVFFDRLGLRPLTAFHIWRIPAGLAFIGFGLDGALPPAFWIPAGFGDVIAGSYAAWVVTRPHGVASYRLFHRIGFADFVIAVGSGLACSLAGDERMELVTILPLAVIPLFGVGISGASHLIAFGLLRRGAGLSDR